MELSGGQFLPPVQTLVATLILPYRAKCISSPASATNNANRKRYRFEKPRNHNGFWVFCAIFQGGIQKISFPKNDSWGGLELKYAKN